MLDEDILEHHQFQLKLHRVLYGLLFVFLTVSFCGELERFHTWYMVLPIGTMVLAVLETVVSKFAFWNRLWVLRVMTYLQYLFFVTMAYLFYTYELSLSLGLSALLVTFMFEFSYYSGITDDLMNVWAFIQLALPALVCQILNFSIRGITIDGFLLLFAYAMLCVFDIVIVRLYYLNERKLVNRINLLFSQIDSMEDSNQELVDFKNRIQKVNDELNLQKIKLTQMNDEIKQYNNELSIQADILKYLNNSFSSDVSEIMDYIIDTIIQVRHVEFCGIYINQGVFYNKHSRCRFKSVSNPDLKAVPEMERLYMEAPDTDEPTVITYLPKEEYPGIRQTKASAIMVLPLILDEQKYGIIVSGSMYRNAFNSKIAFYDTIVPQLNLAMRNIKLLYNTRHIAETDGLTGINNRMHFNKLFEEQAKHTLEMKENLTVAMFDIDHFKHINDTYGHLVGDEVIKAIAHMAYRRIEEQDLGFICRYGGEEFVLVFPNCGLEQALPVIRELHKEIATTLVEAYDQKVSMNVSIGVSSYPSLCEDVDQLIKRADWSMYYAKEHGRGQIKVDGPDVQRV